MYIFCIGPESFPSEIPFISLHHRFGTLFVGRNYNETINKQKSYKMKKMLFLSGMVIALAVSFISCEKNHIEENEIATDLKKKDKDCVSIQDGILIYADGHYLENTPLKTGYDVFGYNYQARMSNGSYANIYLGRAGYPSYEGDDEAYLAENPSAENH